MKTKSLRSVYVPIQQDCTVANKSEIKKDYELFMIQPFEKGCSFTYGDSALPMML